MYVDHFSGLCLRGGLTSGLSFRRTDRQQLQVSRWCQDISITDDLNNTLRAPTMTPHHP